MTANPRMGWRIAPKPGTRLYRTESGRFAMTMEITNDGKHVAEIEYVYTGAEIERLYRQMRDLYSEGISKSPPGSANGAGADRYSRRDLEIEMGQI